MAIKATRILSGILFLIGGVTIAALAIVFGSETVKRAEGVADNHFEFDYLTYMLGIYVIVWMSQVRWFGLFLFCAAQFIVVAIGSVEILLVSTDEAVVHTDGKVVRLGGCFPNSPNHTANTICTSSGEVQNFCTFMIYKPLAALTGFILVFTYMWCYHTRLVWGYSVSTTRKKNKLEWVIFHRFAYTLWIFALLFIYELFDNPIYWFFGEPSTIGRIGGYLLLGVLIFLGSVAFTWIVVGEHHKDIKMHDEDGKEQEMGRLAWRDNTTVFFMTGAAWVVLIIFIYAVIAEFFVYGFDVGLEPFWAFGGSGVSVWVIMVIYCRWWGPKKGDKGWQATHAFDDKYEDGV